MKRAATTYSNSSQTFWAGRAAPSSGTRRTARGRNGRVTLGWKPVAVSLAITLMICATVNYRAYSTLSKEMGQNETLQQKIETMTTENLNLQEEIHYLKTDPATIRREAKRFGILPQK